MVEMARLIPFAPFAPLRSISMPSAGSSTLNSSLRPETSAKAGFVGLERSMAASGVSASNIASRQ